MDPLQWLMLQRELQNRGVDPQSFLDDARSRKVGQPPPLTSSLLNPQPRPTPRPTIDQGSPRMDKAPTGYRGLPPTNPQKVDNSGGGSSLGATMMAGQYPVEMGMVETLPAVEALGLPTPSPYKPMDSGLASILPDYDINALAGAPPSGQPRTASTTQAPAPGGDELPFETYQRLTGNQWTGGRSETIQNLLGNLGINAKPGSAEANLALQKALLSHYGNITD